MRGRYCNAVEQTETHGLIARRVMAGRPHSAEGALPVGTGHHGVDGGDHRPGGAQGSVE